MRSDAGGGGGTGRWDRAAGQGGGAGRPATRAGRVAGIVALLRGHPGFAPLGEGTLGAIARQAPADRIAAARRLFAQGGIGTHRCLVPYGEAEVAVEGEAGPMVVARLGPGQHVHKVAAVAAPPRTATVRVPGPRAASPARAPCRLGAA